jgi:hypothetical protein
MRSFLQPLITSYLLGPNILLSPLASDNTSLCSYLTSLTHRPCVASNAARRLSDYRTQTLDNKQKYHVSARPCPASISNAVFGDRGQSFRWYYFQEVIILQAREAEVLQSGGNVCSLWIVIQTQSWTLRATMTYEGRFTDENYWDYKKSN